MGQLVRLKGETGTVISSRIPPARRIGGELMLTGEPTVTILFSDGTRPPREVCVPQSSWDELEILDEASK
jgi:hypothetical protein